MYSVVNIFAILSLLTFNIIGLCTGDVYEVYVCRFWARITRGKSSNRVSLNSCPLDS